MLLIYTKVNSYFIIQNDLLPGQKLELRPLITAADGEYEVYVESILDSKINKRRKNLL